MADPRRIQLSRFADVALTHRLGSDVALLNGMMHLIIKNGWQNEEYIAARTENYELLAQEVEKYDPKTVSQITGVEVADLEKAGRAVRPQPSGLPALRHGHNPALHRGGQRQVLLQHRPCCAATWAVYGGGVNPLRGQNNVQGACDMGGLPNVFPGYQPVNDLASNKKFSDAWGRAAAGQGGVDHHRHDSRHRRRQTQGPVHHRREPQAVRPGLEPLQPCPEKAGPPVSPGPVPVRNGPGGRRVPGRGLGGGKGRHRDQLGAALHAGQQGHRAHGRLSPGLADHKPPFRGHGPRPWNTTARRRSSTR